MAALGAVAPHPAQACSLQPLGGSGFCPPGGQLSVPHSSSSAHNTALLLPPEPTGAICHPVFRRSWGKGKEKAGKSQMGPVGHPSPDGQVVSGLPPGTWLAPPLQEWRGQVWSSVGMCKRDLLVSLVASALRAVGSVGASCVDLTISVPGLAIPWAFLPASPCLYPRVPLPLHLALHVTLTACVPPSVSVLSQ